MKKKKWHKKKGRWRTYKLVREKHIKYFEKEINELMNEGYKPYGPPFTTKLSDETIDAWKHREEEKYEHYYYHQAMILTKKVFRSSDAPNWTEPPTELGDDDWGDESKLKSDPNAGPYTEYD